MNPTASDLELVAVVAGIIAAARKQFPQIDGVFVYIVAAIIAVAVCYAAAPGPIQAVLLRAGRVAVGAVGGVSLGGYMLGKISVAGVITNVAPSSTTTTTDGGAS